ncbi:hypothetical protein RRG08_037505 [Elysia crispata]|uniref:Uncharacterized protein n=1 Tax=Elysia crispata TaxID=231223 RepID=A0AAE1A3T4_9GAST|nr:hypothetical protein RRG08_037505 [Elysia crispata]
MKSPLFLHTYSRGPTAWPRQCPRGYSPYMTTVLMEDGCEIYHCIQVPRQELEEKPNFPNYDGLLLLVRLLSESSVQALVLSTLLEVYSNANTPWMGQDTPQTDGTTSMRNERTLEAPSPTMGTQN